MTLLISFDDNKLTITRKAILTVTIFTIAGNIAEFFIPDLFSSLDSGYNITGRSAGLYLNANTSGEAIILGMILSYSMLDKKYRTFFLVASLLGVISTFSRTAIASWFVVVAILSYGKVIDKKNIAMVLGSLVLVGIFIVPFVIHYIETNLEAGTVTNLMTRLNFFSSKSQGLDGSQQQRLEVARAALENFANNPLIGAGIAHTSHWEFPISTHNIYLKLMAEYGIIGVFLYPLLILSTVWKAKNEAVAIARAFSIYLLIIGFTTHNSLDEHHLLIAFAVMANLTYHSKTTNSNSPLSSNY
ncbi:MAG: O-antigen ligase family protein [Cocleimonas sp.]